MKRAHTVLLVEDTVQFLDLYRGTLEANGGSVLDRALTGIAGGQQSSGGWPEA